MPLVKTYLEKMGGSIEVESLPAGEAHGQPAGTTFTVKIPLLRAS
jgi:signal transduction histidine kinase